MKRVAHVAFAIVFGLVALVAVATPASAYETECDSSNAGTAPDGRIKVGAENFQGGGSFPITYAYVHVNDAGEQGTFTMKWKNLKGTPQTIRVARVDGEKPPGYAVRYYVGGVLVNDQIDNGIKFTVAPNSSTPALELVIKNKSGAETSFGQTLRGRYRNAPTGQCDLLNPVNAFG